MICGAAQMNRSIRWTSWAGDSTGPVFSSSFRKATTCAMFCANTNSSPRDRTGIERAPMRANSARPAGSSRILIDWNSIPRTERNSLSLRQLVQPGCQNAFNGAVSGIVRSSQSDDPTYACRRGGVNPARRSIGLPASPVLREDRLKRADQRRREAMALNVRRVVTGHDAAGKAIVTIDEVSQNLRSARPGAQPLVLVAGIVDQRGLSGRQYRQRGRGAARDRHDP